MAVRNILCLPALTGDWPSSCGRGVLSTSGFFDMNDAKLERPDLLQKVEMPQPAHDQHGGHWGCAARSEAADPRALRIQLEPGRGRARLGKGGEGFSREDLFTWCTSIRDRHLRIRGHRSAGDHAARAPRRCTPPTGTCTVVANSPAIAAAGRVPPEQRSIQAPRARMGFAEECFSDSDEDICRQAIESPNRRMQAIGGSSSRQRAGSD